MDKVQKTRAQKIVKQTNVLESLKTIASGTKTASQDLLKGASNEFIEQLLGLRTRQNASGEVRPGESLEIGTILSQKEADKQKFQQQIFYERGLAQEESKKSTTKLNELRLHLHALMQEVFNLAQSTQNLGETVEVATMQAPVTPGVYHIVFFENLLAFIKNFRKKIDNAAVWLQASNSRAEKKNFWAMYKKKGSSFLLSPDHYLQRSAG